ncbi:hypothetical protein K440DRAFT_579538 [Wilcoxina mikolae CBS 423.85]|nr:hypothetical protein K440DRAFT_579538 [Wilcoxina mikolae CBS 423.85]
MADRESFFPIPPLIRQIFDSFPLLTYPATPLPSGCPQPSQLPTLYVFSTPEDVSAGKPSFNPSCLKWQAYLKFCGVSYRTGVSNNHASPSGALPFLVPAGDAKQAVQASRLPQWASENARSPRECNLEDPEVKAFLALVDTRVRDAWLYALYLEPHNCHTLAQTLYRSTSVPAVNLLLSSELQKSAAAELRKCRPGGVVNGDDIYADADAAFSALSTVLGDDEWFFGAEEPGLFDATVFGYTHLILTLGWHEKEAAVARGVRRHKNLVAHERRVREFCGW